MVKSNLNTVSDNIVVSNNMVPEVDFVEKETLTETDFAYDLTSHFEHDGTRMSSK